jgi:subtilase family serine protease
MSVTVPGTGWAGHPITITDATKNIGGGIAAPSENAYYLSVNSTLDAADVLLGTRAVPALGANQVSTEAVTLTIPAATTVGTFNIIAKADQAGVVTELLETNNTRSSTINIGPDLFISTVSGPSAATRGATIAVTETTVNQGGAPAPATSTAFYLSANTTLDAGDVLLGSRTIGELAAGTSSNGTTLLTIPTGIATGYYRIIAKCDNGSIVVETAETNNLWQFVIRIDP